MIQTIVRQSMLLLRSKDEAEDQHIEEFFHKTCNCHFGPRSGRDDIVSTCMNCREMTKADLDLVILANLDAHR